MIAGTTSFTIISQSIISRTERSKSTPTVRPTAALILSGEVKSEIVQGTMIKSVHQPSKKIFTSMSPSEDSAQQSPAAIRIIPKMIAFDFFIILSPPDKKLVIEI